MFSFLNTMNSKHLENFSMVSTTFSPFISVSLFEEYEAL